MRRRKNLGAVHCEQSLVGGNYVLAGSNRFEHQLPGDAVATDEFDHDVDVRIGDDGARVVHHLHSPTDHGSGALGVEVGDHRDLDPTTGAAFDFFLIAFKHFESAATDRADAEQAYLDGVHS